MIGTRDGDRHGWRCADCGRAFRDYGKEALREMQARQQEVMRAARNHHQAALHG